MNRSNTLFFWMSDPSSIILVILLTVLMPCSAICAQQQDETSEQVVKRLQDNYRQIDSLSFLFFQKTSGQMSGRPKTGNGNGIFVRTETGSKMRWNYTSPDRQVIISDGKTVSMYFENLNQMIISQVNQAQANILFSFFSEGQDLSENFSILDADPTPDEPEPGAADTIKIVYLVPKDQDSQIRIIHLWITHDSQIRRIELIDHFDTRTTINLAEIKTNSIAADDTKKINEIFEFSPPDGTEIIRQ